MPRKISDETKELIEGLYAQDLPIAEIARRVNVSYPTAYGYTRLRKRINPETKQPFESISQLKDYQARQRINPETGQPFESLSQLTDYRARQRINPETGQLFESLSQYQEHTARQRINRPENQGLSNLIKERLKELGKNQSWLSRKLGVSREAVSKYAQGKYTPDNEVLEKLYSALEVPYKTLDDLLEDVDRLIIS